jgi:hypothetical protein
MWSNVQRKKKRKKKMGYKYAIGQWFARLTRGQMYAFIAATTLALGGAGVGGYYIYDATKSSSGSSGEVYMTNLTLSAAAVNNTIPAAFLNPPQSEVRRLLVVDRVSFANTLRDITQIFFTPSPFALVDVFEGIDEEFTGINELYASIVNVTDRPNCTLNANRVKYNLNVMGQVVPFYAHCYYWINGNSSFHQFGTYKNITYSYLHTDKGSFATRIDGSAVDMWYSRRDADLNVSNWDQYETYAVGQVRADVDAAFPFEMTFSAVDTKFCTLHALYNGSYITTWASSETNTNCSATQTNCYIGAVYTTAISDNVCDSRFVPKIPVLKRLAGNHSAYSPLWANLTFGASNLTGVSAPSVTDVTFNGQDTDSVNFGPSHPTENVLEWSLD